MLLWNHEILLMIQYCSHKTVIWKICQENKSIPTVCHLHVISISSIFLLLVYEFCMQFVLKDSTFHAIVTYSFGFKVKSCQNCANISISYLPGHTVGSRGRVVKATDLKSVGIFPRRFESCRLRIVDHVLLELETAWENSNRFPVFCPP